MNEKEENGLTGKDPLAHDEFVAQAPVTSKTDERPQSGHATALNIVVNPLKVSFAKIHSKTELVALHQVGLKYSY
jgi:hypothetical protein